MSKSKLKKELSGMTQEQTADLLLQVYDSIKEAKAWLDFYVDPDIEGLLEKYRKQIHTKCYGRNGTARRPKFRDCTKLIATFGRIVQDPYPIADLMLYFMEQATNVPGKGGRGGESYCHTLAGHFSKTIDYIESSGLTADFLPRIEKLIREAKRCGYGLEDEYRNILNNAQLIMHNS